MKVMASFLYISVAKKCHYDPLLLQPVILIPDAELILGHEAHGSERWVVLSYLSIEVVRSPDVQLLLVRVLLVGFKWKGQSCFIQIFFQLLLTFYYVFVTWFSKLLI